MRNLELVLFVGSKDGEATTLQDGDMMVVQDVGTIGFHRDGRRLVGSGGDDKVYIPGEAEHGHVRSFLSHVGINAELVVDERGMKGYRLFRRKT